MNIQKLIQVIVIILLQYGCTAQEKYDKAESWLLEFTSSDIGTVQTFMFFEFQDSTFSAFTREGADRDILGFWTSSLGRIFTSDFENGSLLHVKKGIYKVRNDTIILSGIFTSAMGNYYFNGTIHNNILEAELTTKSKKVKGKITGSPNSKETSLNDYPLICKEIMNVASDKIYDPSILNSKEWKKFCKNMSNTSSKVKDDLEMVFAFFYHAGKLPFSHFSLFRSQQDDNVNDDEYDQQVFLEEKNSGTVYMRIESFSGSVEEMDSVMSFVKAKNYPNLIVDLRDNPGGSVAAGLTFASNIVDSAFYGGIFLTQKYFNEYTEIPNVKKYNQFPLFTEANFDLIIEGIHNEKGLCLRVVPQEEVYSGNIFILTNGNTGSTCEPIVYGFKQYNQATIVGETTAGVMLNGEIFELESGFSLVVPTATYYTSDGNKIDKVGVVPDIKIESNQALDYVLENLIK